MKNGVRLFYSIFTHNTKKVPLWNNFSSEDWSEILLIVVFLLLLFGGKKLPELMRGAGRGIKEFKDAVNKPIEEDDDKPEAKITTTTTNTKE